MISIATLGPKGSHAWQAARRHQADAHIKLFTRITEVIEAFLRQETDLAVIPVYNTREGENKEAFRLLESLTPDCGYWVDNVVLPIHLSLGLPSAQSACNVLVGSSSILRQSDNYISTHFPNTTQVAVQDLAGYLNNFQDQDRTDFCVIEAEEFLIAHGLIIKEREVAPYNRSRFAVIGRVLPEPSGYDATILQTTPLKDRVGLLFDILAEFSRRGINLLDMRTDTDIKSQKLQFFFETEGHINDRSLAEALDRIANQVIQEPASIRVLGSFPRIDMRAKRIKNIGFIGTGDMSRWFASRLENESYKIMLTGRTSVIKPEEMIPQVDMVIICVPISATPETIARYGALLKDGQALVLLAGEAEIAVQAALRHTRPGVEIMLVHNLWGPKAATMKDKNASIVRTLRSGSLCSEFESFLYKHGAIISQDSPERHDLLMAVGQKLPTTISLALAMTMRTNNIAPADIDTHSTLTSLYGILAMARVHSQNPRTYAEILAAPSAGNKIIRDFSAHLIQVLELSEASNISGINLLIEQGREFLTEEFLRSRTIQTLAVDETLNRFIRS